MAYAQTTDVEVRLGRSASSNAETLQWGAWLNDVEALILARIPDLASRIADETISEGIVVMVEANAVIRKARNPEGKVSEQIDDYSYRYGEDARRGDLFLTDEEWALLDPASGTGAFTIRPWADAVGRGYWSRPDLWVPLP